MTTQEKSSIVSTYSFTTLQSIRYLNRLQRLQLSGQLLFSQPKGQQWIFHLHQGEVIHGSGGIHPVRRWQRNLAIHCPQIVANSYLIKRDLASIEPTISWDYQLLELWIKEERITRQQATATLHAGMVEMLFDLGQTSNLTHQFKPTCLPSNRLVEIDLLKVIADVERLWRAWHNANLGNYSPNQSPIIEQPDKLKQRTSVELYQTLTKCLDGKHTLRDLAVQRKWDLVEIARSLLPYLELGLIQFQEIPDVSTFLSPTILGTPGEIANFTKPLVACVDDSKWVNQMMEKLITTAGYRFMAVDNPLRAIPVLLARKPDFIFLDLMMPHVNGYEVCTQLRKLSCFRTTPIAILTGNNGSTEIIRSKLAGASDFLSKPLNAVSLLKVLHKYLN
ncbi:MAG TPA: response regulator [Cyanobacteria bacterium UBA11149]|nr:response regulator [Cyanobacteria bacterium UBA11367]HBE60585.1 response regulator [Cyanobacteria bacterium UBA11366]HBK65173.1 response regulator [Cyanobacteria bacterium UBA11166]HBR72923.1 response regulator [Cyanobacteria bacterium UBA11159]HBS69034.1 response regulator [Cyanobacteria bacterium UBA11153]HBW89561.1 response regulator [Cyanobacteria bacterium UBA11149]HCA93424.1 response regulator [Cyanobacteria bacterium UBA9226]